MSETFGIFWLLQSAENCDDFNHHKIKLHICGKKYTLGVGVDSGSQSQHIAKKE